MMMIIIVVIMLINGTQAGNSQDDTATIITTGHSVRSAKLRKMLKSCQPKRQYEVRLGKTKTSCWNEECLRATDNTHGLYHFSDLLNSLRDGETRIPSLRSCTARTAHVPLIQGLLDSPAQT
mmetsp:Transcript_105109/g.181654  ORF Transcript_105109/g.181654 Transcript_105109/m.181654 type:complete len:122 (+) Transcript_105109:3-368(+)